MFGKEYKATLKAYQEMIELLQKEKTELFNRLMARNFQELQMLNEAFPVTQNVIIEKPEKSFSAENAGEYDESHIGDIVADPSV